MLCDTLIANGAPGYGAEPARMRSVIERVRTATRFTLDDDFAAVAEGLADDYTGLVRVFPFCRLPYARCWFEFAQSQRPVFSSADTHVPEAQVRPHRIGFLCDALRDDLSEWRAHLFWSIHASPDQCSAAAIAIDMSMKDPYADVDEKVVNEPYTGLKHFPDGKTLPHEGWKSASSSVRMAMLRHTMPVMPDYGTPNPPYGLTLAEQEQFAEMILDLARADWAGEVAYLLAVIGMLNTRNAAETVRVDRSKINKSRIRSGKPPLMEHHLLTVHTKRKQRVFGGKGTGDKHAAMRGHFCRGHFKKRKTGIYFWHPHARGDFSRGTVTKDYALAD